MACSEYQAVVIVSEGFFTEVTDERDSVSANLFNFSLTISLM